MTFRLRARKRSSPSRCPASLRSGRLALTALVVVGLSFGLGPLGCSSSSTSVANPADSGDQDASGLDTDAQVVPDDSGAHDGAVADAKPDSGKLPFGATCLDDKDCDSNVCAPNDTGGDYWCSYRCSTSTQLQKCPKPETSGTCNSHGYCRP